MLSQAFDVAVTGRDENFCNVHYNELQMLCKEYENQIKYETSTVDNCGEFNDPYESLFHISDRLRSLAIRIIETNKREEEGKNNT